jgi:very-short-patch-repair endonuclease
MNKKISKEEILQRFKNKGLTIIEEFDEKIINSKTKLKCIDSEGYLYSHSYNNVSSKNSQRRFSKYNPYILYNMQHFIELNGSETKIINDKFIGQNKEVYTLKCGKCGKVFTKTYGDFMYRKHFYCHECTMKVNPKKYTNEYVDKVLNTFGYIRLEEYKGNNDNILCINEDGYKVKIKFATILRGDKNPYIFSTVFNSENYIYNINNYFKINNINCKALYYDFSVYKDDDKDKTPTVYCQCQCGEIFHTNINAIRTQNQYRCQKCSNSISMIEYKVKRWLDSKHIEYEQQKTFEGCMGDSRYLKFDYYLPKYNLCIEVDGEQHDVVTTFGGEKCIEDTIERFKKRQRYDKIKDDYCQKHNIKLLRIPEKYLERNNNIYKKILYNTLIKK